MELKANSQTEATTKTAEGRSDPLAQTLRLFVSSHLDLL